MKCSRFVTSAILVVIALAACTRKKGNDYGLDMRETLRVNLETEPPTLDYTKATDNVSSWININIMEGLVAYDYSSPDLKPVPALAESWEGSDKFKTWTFKLRKNVKWSDGVELKAQHFVDSWERLLNPATASEYSYFLYNIVNAKEYYERKVKDFKEVGITTPDDYTLVVKLKSSISFFPYLFTQRVTYPLRKDVLEKNGNATFSDPSKMVVIGPFKVKLWDHDNVLILERNESYYGEKPKIKNILGYMVNEGSTAINLFDSGKVDLLPQFPSTEVAKQKLRPEYRFYNTLILQYYGINTKKKPMDNVNVRRAVISAIDTKEITEMLAGNQYPLRSWVPKGMFGFNGERGLPFNPEKAKEYLTKAGFEDPTKLPRIVIGINTSEDLKRIAENVQAQLKRNLGINVEIQNEEWKVYLSRLNTDTPHIYRMGWQADYPDPDNFMTQMASFSENNHTHWKSKTYDDLVERAASEGDKTKRLQLYDQAQKILLEEDAVVIPLYTSTRQKLISTRVENYPGNPLDHQDYRKVNLKQ